MRINHNISALNSYRNLSQNQIGMGKVLEKLSSGYRINRASDDAAGLAISEKMRGQIRGLQQGQRNTMDGISLIQTAEGALQEVHAMLQRMRELAVQAANDTYSTTDKKASQDEVNELLKQIDDIAKTTEFNGVLLLSSGKNPNGVIGISGKIGIQFGANTDNYLELKLSGGINKTITKSGVNTTFTLQISGARIDLKTLKLVSGGYPGINMSQLLWTSEGARNAIAIFDNAVQAVSAIRSYFGAINNRLEHAVNNLSNYAENLTAAESRIRDADMAKEMTEFTKYNIINQSATAMLAQANQLPQGVLQLLKG
ncbi:flagellin N-terminal helical domain-containing protein [Aneurinibacillus danicus]|jgi:flagellin|uniref:Flagellin n=1 Tax=Aneurinibacillus danicus TaxID=267746 RepID=A0A511VF55_9BACL|nr:flagellin [Aneurinibacillus danicus]GEN36183.1 flagellin [Aneurinibacillus danicus]